MFIRPWQHWHRCIYQVRSRSLCRDLYISYSKDNHFPFPTLNQWMTLNSCNEFANAGIEKPDIKHDIIYPQIARFMGPTWGPPGSCRPQMGPMLTPRTLLSGSEFHIQCHCHAIYMSATSWYHQHYQSYTCVPSQFTFFCKCNCPKLSLGPNSIRNCQTDQAQSKTTSSGMMDEVGNKWQTYCLSTQMIFVFFILCLSM